MFLRNVLLKIGFLDLNEKRMNRLIQESDEKMILWAFNNGLYNIRRMAIQFFGSSDSSLSHSVLRAAMNDDTELVSQEAMTELENLDVSSELIKEIAEKRQFWKDENAHREGRRKRAHRKFSVFTESKERGSKKSLDSAKKMLKKPMLGGKWF